MDKCQTHPRYRPNGGGSEYVATENLRINAWQLGDEIFEVHSGAPCTLSKHFHDTYQIAFTTRHPGEYVCDGKTLLAPPGSVIIFHPGEVHSTVGQSMRHEHDSSKLIYVNAERFADIASSVCSEGNTPPIFDRRVVTKHQLISRFTNVHSLSRTSASQLEKESELMFLLSDLVSGYAAHSPKLDGLQRNRHRALMVQDYLHAHYRDNISLDTLSRHTHTSPYHLNRLFSREFGMPPHAFQTQIRLEHAKRLLLKGCSVAATATSVGFYDQSHLTRYFKRIVGVSPQTYAAQA